MFLKANEEIREHITRNTQLSLSDSEKKNEQVVENIKKQY
jgi:hypothetical protein